MKKLLAILILATLSLVFMGCTARQEAPYVLECKAGGGEWKTLSTTCTDSCLYQGESIEPIACGQALTDGCDCGPNKCWNGTSCKSNPV